MRHVCGVILILLVAPLVRADAGLPSFGPRPQAAVHFAQFEGLDKYPDYTFFLAPAGVKVAAGTVVHTPPGAQLVAVPKNIARESDIWSPEWNKPGLPGVLRSRDIQEFQRRFSAIGVPSVTTQFHVELTGDELKCTRGKEDVVIPPDNRPSAWAVLGGVCGGMALTVAIIVAGLVWIIRRLARAPRTKSV
jgi:hypothetical protein